MTERTCYTCGREIPESEEREGPYFDWRDRGHCLACITEMMGEAEKAWLSERLGYVEDPKSAADILRRLFGIS